MLRLFAVVLGGRAEKCNVELHDVVFVIGNNLKETYPQLQNKWFGLRKDLHIDSYIELKQIDGHAITISKERPTDNKKLFFVNFGGYKEKHFGEVHSAAFYVESSKTDVLARAKKDYDQNFLQPHCDDNLLIDDLIQINEIDDHYIHLIPTTKIEEFNIVSNYKRLDA